MNEVTHVSDVIHSFYFDRFVDVLCGNTTPKTDMIPWYLELWSLQKIIYIYDMKYIVLTRP